MQKLFHPALGKTISSSTPTSMQISEHHVWRRSYRGDLKLKLPAAICDFGSELWNFYLWNSRLLSTNPLRIYAVYVCPVLQYGHPVFIDTNPEHLEPLYRNESRALSVIHWCYQSKFPIKHSIDMQISLSSMTCSPYVWPLAASYSF